MLTVDHCTVYVAISVLGSVAAKSTANVWETIQLSTFVSPLLYVGFLQKMLSQKGIDIEIVSFKQEA